MNNQTDLSPVAKRYKLATENVLNRYRNEKGRNGLSQKWLIAALEEDRVYGKFNSGIMCSFLEAVEDEFKKLENVVFPDFKNSDKSLEVPILSLAPPVENPNIDPPNYGVFPNHENN